MDWGRATTGIIPAGHTARSDPQHCSDEGQKDRLDWYTQHRRLWIIIRKEGRGIDMTASTTGKSLPAIRWRPWNELVQKEQGRGKRRQKIRRHREDQMERRRKTEGARKRSCAAHCRPLQFAHVSGGRVCPMTRGSWCSESPMLSPRRIWVWRRPLPILPRLVDPVGSIYFS